MSTLKFCAFVITQIICISGIYAGAMMRQWRVIDIAVACAVIALISYTAAEAAVEMDKHGKEKAEDGQSREC